MPTLNIGGSRAADRVSWATLRQYRGFTMIRRLVATLGYQGLFTGTRGTTPDLISRATAGVPSHRREQYLGEDGGISGRRIETAEERQC